MSDQNEIIRRARRGDPEAIMELLAAHEERLRALAESELGSRLRARVRVSDVLQSTFLDVIKGGFRGGTAEEFLRYAENALRNNVRDLARRFDAARRREDPAPSSPGESRFGVEGTTPSAQVVSAEEAALVRGAMEELSDEHRRVIEARLDGTPYELLAEELGKTPEALRQLHRRAQATLMSIVFRRLGGEP